MVCDIVVTHNFFIEKVAKLIDPERVPDGGKFCCVTIFKLKRDPSASDGVVVTLLKAENDDHVVSKSPEASH